MTELKPCPFCGGSAEITDFSLSYEVECSMCGATISALTIYCADDDEKLSVRNAVIEAWNRHVGCEGE